MNDTVKISAIVTAYNVEKYIGRTLESVLSQRSRADEIIVVDDGSTDATANRIKAYGNQVRYIYQDNGGASLARNRGIGAAQCKWIAFLDGDDEWLPPHLEQQRELLQRYPDLVWSTGNYFRCLCWENRKTPDIPADRIRKHLSSRDRLEDYLKHYVHGLTGHSDTMVIKRSVLINTGLFTPGQKRANDLDMWWRIAYQHAAIGYIAEPLAVHHMDVTGSISRRYSEIELYRDLIDRHLILAAEQNRLTALKPCATRILQFWMRGQLFAGNGKGIRKMLDHFDDLIPRRIILWFRLLTLFPRITAIGCHGVSKIIRKMRLRRQLVRKPNS